MKKGLKITEGHYLNMDSMVEWWTAADGTLTICTVLTDGDPITIVSDSSTSLGRHTEKVSVNELHRIKREIDEYMELTHQERLTSVK